MQLMIKYQLKKILNKLTQSTQLTMTNRFQRINKLTNNNRYNRIIKIISKMRFQFKNQYKQIFKKIKIFQINKERMLFLKINLQKRKLNKTKLVFQKNLSVKLRIK